MKQTPEYRRQYREKRRASGICDDCGGPKKLTTLKCEECNKKQRGRVRANYAEYRAAGLCVHCTKPSRPGRTRCTRCLDVAMKRHRMKKYGVSQEDYEAMLAEQEHACAICRTKFTTRTLSRADSPNIDHDHRLDDKNEAVRGILCGLCNRMIGGCRDNPAILRAAAEYLNA
jgi:hypothetical protein